jgi:hypothetical protein
MDSPSGSQARRNALSPSSAVPAGSTGYQGELVLPISIGLPQVARYAMKSALIVKAVK